MAFSVFNLDRNLLKGLKELGFSRPTPIQTDAIPPALEGRDVLACASTGSGKTAAFLLPILNRLVTRPRGKTRALVLTPTRELAAQIVEQLNALAVHTPVTAWPIIGGVGMGPQEHAFRSGMDVLVATPGRLLDHLRSPYARLDSVEYLVLDEADRMLDMGFLPAIRRVLAMLPIKRQTLLFSATMSSSIEHLARSTMKQPKLIEVNQRGQAATMVEQTAYPVAQESKTALLLDLLERERFERVLVFTRTRRGAERLAHILEARDHSVNRIHADRSQSQRETALRDFRDGRTRVLVATDIAARGLDVEAVSHVINYDVPAAPEDYVHRVGRTGRAGNLGQAFTIVAPVDELSMRAIERLTGQTVKRVVLPAFGGAVPTTTSSKTYARFARGSSSSSVRSFRPRRAR